MTIVYWITKWRWWRKKVILRPVDSRQVKKEGSTVPEKPTWLSEGVTDVVETIFCFAFEGRKRDGTNAEYEKSTEVKFLYESYVEVASHFKIW